MISESVKNHMLEVAAEQKKEIPKNYLDILGKYFEIAKKLGCNLEFKEKLPPDRETLNANSGCRTKKITATSRWAAELVLNDTFESQNAFFITIGHELSHKSKELFWLRLPIRNLKFVAHVNEVHADFNATKVMCDFNRAMLVASCEYKKKFKEEKYKKEGKPFVDKDRLSHPSWTRRIIYAKEYNFDKDLIYRIADDTGCKNKRLIKKAIKFYDEIVLK